MRLGVRYNSSWLQIPISPHIQADDDDAEPETHECRHAGTGKLDPGHRTPRFVIRSYMTIEPAVATFSETVPGIFIVVAARVIRSGNP